MSDQARVEAGQPLGPAGERFTVRPTSDSHFAWVRTRLSVERTLMSWVRTAVSLIGFGFAIVQFFSRLQDMPGAAPGRMPRASLYLGLALILCGVLGLVVSLWQYWWTVRYLSSGNFAAIAVMKDDPMKPPSVAITCLLIVIGLCAFFAVLFRLV